MTFNVFAGAVVQGPKRVLILDSFGKRFAPYTTVSASFQTELAERSPVPIEFHEVSLEGQQFTGSETDEPTVNYVRTLFGGQEPDLVVPFGGLAARFAMRMRTQLFPSTPLLLAAFDGRSLRTLTLDTNTTAVPARIDYQDLIENVCRVLPETKNIAFVIGSSPLEGFLKQEIQRDLSGFTNRLVFIWLDHYSLDQLRRRVKVLPPHTVIFYVSLFMDANGVPYEYDRATKSLTAEANSPMVGLFEEELGLGIVGGPMLNLHELGGQTAQVAVRLLNGERLGNVVDLPAATPGTPVYDWRALRRWNISESRLPMGSKMQYIEPTIWDRHKRFIAGVLSLVLVLSIFTAGTIVNLNRRQKAERSLHESEERMKLAARAAALGVWEWDFSTNKVRVDGISQINGRHENGENGTPQINRFLKTVHPEDQEAVAAALATAIVGDGDFQHIHRQLLQNGDVRWIASQGTVEFDAERKPLRMRGVGIDITERKQAEERARDSERQFVLTANAAPVFIWTASPEKQCTFCNQPWLDFRGTTMEEESGNGWQNGVHPEDLADVLKVFSESFDGRKPFTIEYRVRRHDGQYRWLLKHGMPRYDAEKQFLGFIGSCVDITEKREAEVQARRWQSELAHVGRLSMLWELAGSMAHELRQPLTAIVNSAGAGRRFMEGDRKDEAEVRAALEDIEEQGARAGEIITEMRAMLKKDPGQMAPRDINLKIRTVLEMVRSDLVMRHLTPELRLDTTLPLVNCYNVQLRQVLLNLVVNAWDAMEEMPAGQRKLIIESRRVGVDEIEVSVSDTGCGFPEEMLRQPFESFRTTKAKGLGLGLAICRSIITAHEGRLELANNAGAGATVKFILPTNNFRV